MMLCILVFVQIRRQAIKELPRFATGENILRVADILTQLLQTGIKGFKLNTQETFMYVLGNVFVVQDKLTDRGGLYYKHSHDVYVSHCYQSIFQSL